MTNPEYFYAGLIVLVLVGLAGYYGWRQWQALRGLRRLDNLSSADRQYHQGQAWRRLTSCVLMVVLAGLLVGWYSLGQERRAQELSQANKAAKARGEPPGPNPQQKQFVHQYSA